MLDRFGIKLAISFPEGAGLLGTKIEVTDQGSSGTMYFDAQAGHFTETQMTQKMTIQLTIRDKQVDQKVESTMRMVVGAVKQAGRIGDPTSTLPLP